MSHQLMPSKREFPGGRSINNFGSLSSSGYIAKYDTTILIIGVAISGWITSKLRPTARQLQAFSMSVAFLLCCSMVGYIFYGCDQQSLTGEGGMASECSRACDCEGIKYSPVCGSDAITYNSPCEAGCLSYNEMNRQFDNCSCINTNSGAGNGIRLGFARDGPCQSDKCKYPLYFFLGTQAATIFLSATTWTSDTIITMRSVDPRDKAFSLSLYDLMGSVLVSIPAPIIYGNILDSICIRRDVESNESTFCRIYDHKLFR